VNYNLLEELGIKTFWPVEYQNSRLLGRTNNLINRRTIFYGCCQVIWQNSFFGHGSRGQHGFAVKRRKTAKRPSTP